MTYTQPKVDTLGEATSLIESLLLKVRWLNDSVLPFPNSAPAYDLDD